MARTFPEKQQGGFTGQKSAEKKGYKMVSLFFLLPYGLKYLLEVIFGRVPEVHGLRALGNQNACRSTGFIVPQASYMPHIFLWLFPPLLSAAPWLFQGRYVPEKRSVLRP